MLHPADLSASRYGALVEQASVRGTGHDLRAAANLVVGVTNTLGAAFTSRLGAVGYHAFFAAKHYVVE